MSSQAYTPGLKRKEKCVVKKVRKLPVPGEVLVKVGETVSPDTVIARASVPGKPVTCNIAYKLGVDPNEIERYILKKFGDPVTENEPIALYKSLFGLIKRACPSPCNGTIEHISNVTGQVIIREPPIEIEVNAYIPGTVIETLPKEGAVIQSPAAFIQGIFGIGGEAYGELMIVSEKPEDVVEPKNITSNCKGKVLVGGALVTGDALRKALEVGAKAIVVGGINEMDLKNFLGYEIGVAITGHEKIGLTLILTEGFGEMRMLENTFDILRKFDGKLACVNGATQIRAGVLRPEVVIPRSDISLAELQEFEEDSCSQSTGLRVGTLVRIIREPYFGALGKVVRLPAKLQKIETESHVRVLEVELKDKTRVTVPRANVEIIEE